MFVLSQMLQEYRKSQVELERIMGKDLKMDFISFSWIKFYKALV